MAKKNIKDSVAKVAAESKKAYGFNPITKEFTGECTAWLSPLDEEPTYLLPANSTFIEPPVQKDGFVRTFDGVAWSYLGGEVTK